MMQTIIHPKAEAPTNDQTPAPVPTEPNAPATDPAPQPEETEPKAVALEARVAALEATAKETLEAVRSLRAAMITGAGDGTRGDHAGDHAALPSGDPENPLAKVMAMPDGKERSAYVAAHADAILKAAFAARDAH